MSFQKSEASKVARAVSLAARSAQASGLVKCYVEMLHLPSGVPDLRLREKRTGRTVRVLTMQPLLKQAIPLSNLLQDCYAHGGGLTERRSLREFISISAPVVTQNAEEICVEWSDTFSVKVNIVTADIVSAPVSVWCYIEEYQLEGGNVGVRLRQKSTGRKVEMYGKNKDHLVKFLTSPRFTGAEEFMPNLYEKDGYRDYVLVSGGTAVDSYDVLRFNDGTELTYLLGPTPDTAYRDAFRALKDEKAATAHSRRAVEHFNDGLYREAILSARLAVEVACGGRGSDVKTRLADAPPDISQAGVILQSKRGLAVHEGDTRVEQQDAQEAIDAMNSLLDHLNIDATQT